MAGELPSVDALALWDLSGTRTPAELLGVLPIAFVDGEPGSPWAGRSFWREGDRMAPMTRRDLLWFMVDVQRYRPLATVVLAVALVLPSLGSWRPATCPPSPCCSAWPWPWHSVPYSSGR